FCLGLQRRINGTSAIGRGGGLCPPPLTTAVLQDPSKKVVMARAQCEPDFLRPTRPLLRPAGGAGPEPPAAGRSAPRCRADGAAGPRACRSAPRDPRRVAW